MYSQLGNIQFQAMLGPGSLSTSVESELPEIQLINGKPRLQRTGTNLETVDISIRFHVGFCNPSEKYAELRKFLDTGEILPYIGGNGEIYGDFVIKSLNRNITRKFPDGTPMEIMVDLTMVEWAGEPTEKPTQTLATDADNPATVDANVQPSGAAFTAGADVVSTNAHGTAAAGLMSALDATDVFRPQVEKIIREVNITANGALKIKTAVDSDPDTQLYTVTRQLSTACQEIIDLSGDIVTAANDLLSDIDNNDTGGIATNVATLIGDSQDLAQRNKDMVTASAGLNNLILTGNG